MKRLDHFTHPDTTDHPLEPPLCFQALGQIVSNSHLSHMTSPLFFAGNAKLKPELFHGLAHERGEICRFPGRDQIGVNNHLPVLIECAGLF